MRTYNEGAALLFVGFGQPTHILKYLYARVIINEDGVVIVLAIENRSENGAYIDEYTNRVERDA